MYGYKTYYEVLILPGEKQISSHLHWSCNSSCRQAAQVPNQYNFGAGNALPSARPSKNTHVHESNARCVAQC